MSGIVGSLFNHRGSGIIAKLGTDGHTFNSGGAGKKALTEAVVVVADGVDGSKLADDAVDSEHYTNASIDNAHLADDAVDSDELAAGSVDAAHLAADIITGAKIADDAIDSEHYTDGSIDNAHLADDAVDSDELAAGAVDTAHIADNQITLAKMAGLARGKVIYGDSSGDPAALAVGSANEVLTHDGTDISWAAAGGFDVSSITGATALGATPASTDEFVLSDAGTLKRMDATFMMGRPMFKAYLGSDVTISDDTVTDLVCGSEDFDIDSKYNVSDGRFTPTVPGVYIVGAYVRTRGTSAFDNFYIYLNKNTSSAAFTSAGHVRTNTAHATTIVYLDADDYVVARVYQGSGGNLDMEAGIGSTAFWGCRIVGYE